MERARYEEAGPGEGAGKRLEALRVKVLAKHPVRGWAPMQDRGRHHITAKHYEPAERDRTRANTVCARTMEHPRRPIAGETLAEQMSGVTKPLRRHQLHVLLSSD